MNTQTHTTCHNPACRKPLERRDAHLRSISLEQVAFCSTACIEVFGELDGASRGPALIPEQRQTTTSASADVTRG